MRSNAIVQDGESGGQHAPQSGDPQVTADSTVVEPAGKSDAPAQPDPVRKFVLIVGGSSLAFFLAIACVAIYIYYERHSLDASSRAFVQASVPAIVSTWSKDELLKRSAPELLKDADEHPEQLDQLFQKLSKLGAMRNFDV